MLDLIKLQVSPPASKQGRETSSARSARAEVRNPILALPAAARLAELSEKERETLIAILLDIKTDATDRANVCWKKHKAPMAAYWKAVSVYSGHIVRAIRTRQIGRAHVCTPVTNAHLVCRHLLEQKKTPPYPTLYLPLPHVPALRDHPGHVAVRHHLYPPCTPPAPAP